MADLSNVTFQPQNPDALFSPDQWSNQFSRFNNAALPWPSSYVGYPTDALGNFINPQAGSGIPTQAQWQAGQAAPAAAGSSAPGTTINSNPMQGQQPGGTINYAGMGPAGSAVQELMNNYQAAQAKLSPQQQYNQQQANAFRQQMLQQQDNITASANAGGGFGRSPGGAFNPGPSGVANMPMAQAAPQQAPQQAAPAASNGLTYPQVLALLANPGKVTTPGATVPAGPSSQPGAGVNNAFLQQAQGRPGMNQNFLSTLAALQGRGGQ